MSTKKPTAKEFVDAVKVVVVFLASLLPAAAKPAATTGKTATRGKGKGKAATDDLDDLDLDDGGGDDLDDLEFDGHDEGNDMEEPDERYGQLRTLLTKLAKGTKSKDLGYRILEKFNSKDVDAVAAEDLDQAIKVTKAQLTKKKIKH